MTGRTNWDRVKVTGYRQMGQWWESRRKRRSDEGFKAHVKCRLALQCIEGKAFGEAGGNL